MFVGELSVINDSMCRAISFSRHLAITGVRVIALMSLASFACLDLAGGMIPAVLLILGV